MSYMFLVETYETEREKVISVWSEFRDADLPFRPHPTDSRGRSVHEQMVHQCVSEDFWFRAMLGIDVGAPPLPQPETRLEFMKRYAEDSAKRLAILKEKGAAWWEEIVTFFDVPRSRAWIMVRRIAHTAHHRGQQMAMLRMLNHSTPQQLRPHRRHRRPHAKPRAHDLRLFKSGRAVRRRISRWSEDSVAGPRRQATNRAPRREIEG